MKSLSHTRTISMEGVFGPFSILTYPIFRLDFSYETISGIKVTKEIILALRLPPLSTVRCFMCGANLLIKRVYI